MYQADIEVIEALDRSDNVLGYGSNWRNQSQKSVAFVNQSTTYSRSLVAELRNSDNALSTNPDYATMESSLLRVSTGSASIAESLTGYGADLQLFTKNRDDAKFWYSPRVRFYMFSHAVLAGLVVVWAFGCSCMPWCGARANIWTKYLMSTLTWTYTILAICVFASAGVGMFGTTVVADICVEFNTAAMKHTAGRDLVDYTVFCAANDTRLNSTTYNSLGDTRVGWTNAEASLQRVEKSSATYTAAQKRKLNELRGAGCH